MIGTPPRPSIALCLAAALGLAALAPQAQPEAAPAPPPTARRGGHGAPGDIDPAIRPGPEHERLMKLAGHYTTVSRASFPGAAEPVESRGEAIFRATLGGRFLAQEEAGQMLGMPFEAAKLWGFNNATGRYESVWAYTGSTAMMILRSEADAGEGRIVLTGDVDGGDTPLRVVLEPIDADRFRITLTMAGAEGSDQGAGPTLETVYTRKK